MFSFRNDPDADGFGVAFFDGVGPGGTRLDLSVVRGLRSAHWVAVESALGVRVVQVEQVHRARVVKVGTDTPVATLLAEPADAMVTTRRGVGLAVRTADCLPVLLADPLAGVVAAAHAGRAGLAAGVLAETTSAMFELGATDVTAWIGPHICRSCYEVGSQTYADFLAVHPQAAATTSWGTPSLDLGRAAITQLSGLGVRVIKADPCTFTTPTLHSHRRDQESAGRQAGVVWLR